MPAKSYSFATLNAPGPGAGYTIPTAINASGVVAGYYGNGIAVHGFVDNKGTYSTTTAGGNLYRSNWYKRQW